MTAFACDRCGRGLLTDADVRYQVQIDVTAAYDPLEVTSADLDADHAAAMDSLLRQLDGLTEEEANDSIHKRMKFDLCATCQPSYLKSPLGVAGHDGAAS